jgi:hypothetical protein
VAGGVGLVLREEALDQEVLFGVAAQGAGDGGEAGGGALGGREDAGEVLEVVGAFVGVVCVVVGDAGRVLCSAIKIYSKTAIGEDLVGEDAVAG